MKKSVPQDAAAQRAPRPSKTAASAPAHKTTDSAVTIRPVRRADLDSIVAIDTLVTGMEKRENWNSVYRKYGRAATPGQHFLIALKDDEVIGFVIGEVRDWEFGSPPCGWVFAIDVRPDARLGGTASALLQAICAGFKKLGVTKVRTLLALDNTLILSFFRSQGMMIAPFIPLEMDLDS
jgi:N-acetylglutamate synthase-like GNAT family acetyltransferase